VAADWVKQGEYRELLRRLNVPIERLAGRRVGPPEGRIRIRAEAAMAATTASSDHRTTGSGDFGRVHRHRRRWWAANL
jgi:hypothetical protein